jgi:hypothetical protein
MYLESTAYQIRQTIGQAIAKNHHICVFQCESVANNPCSSEALYSSGKNDTIIVIYLIFVI